jgi:LEA14-like dessication related protein
MLHFKSIGVIFILFVCLITGCKPFKEAECTGFKGFTMNKIDMKGLDADIQLGIKNPNSIGFSIYKSEFDVIFNGIYLGKAKSVKRVHIDANSEKTYSFNLKSDFKNVNIMDVMKLASGGGSGQIQVKGNLKAGKFYLKKSFPVDEKERISLN